MAKKEFGNIVSDLVVKPLEEKRTVQQSIVKSPSKFKIQLDDSNASKRTFYIRTDLGAQFDIFSASSRIDKGALINVALKEWLEQNQGRVEFEQF